MSPPVISVQQVSDNLIAQFEATFAQTIPIFPRSFARVLCKAVGGAFVLVYKYVGWGILQQFVQHASSATTVVNGKTLIPLVEWGRLIGLGDPNPAVPTEMRIAVTVTNQTGSLPAFSKLINSTTNVVYEVAFAVALNASTINATIRPTSDQSGGDGSGAIGNMQIGDTISFAQPLANINRDATITSIIVTGVDAEDMEGSYRPRVVKRFQAQPQGGAYADYRDWAMTVPGIANAYPYTSDSPGCVDVYIEATVASSGNADGIPTTAQLTAAAAAIEVDPNAAPGLANRRPANAAVNVLPIHRTPYDVEVNNLFPPSDTDVETAIRDGLDDFFRSRESFIDGLGTFPRDDRITQASVSGTVEEIASALGSSISSVTLKVHGSPTTAETLSKGEKAKRGEVTFI